MAIDKALKMDLPALAEMLRSKGRGRDTILAHITPKEAALLKRRGGRGSTNPDTGLPEFEEDFNYDIGFGPDQYTPQPTPQEIQGTTFTPQENAMYGYSDSAPTFDPNAQVQQTVEGPVGPASFNAPGAQAGDIPVMAGTGATTGLYQNNKYPSAGQMTSYAAGTGVPTDIAQTDVPVAPTPLTAAKDQSYLDKLLDPKTLAALGLTGTQLANMAGRTVAATGLGAYGANQARQAAGQIQAATQQQQNIAQPYQTQGQTLVRQAQSGELTPASQQAYQAAKAQLLQGVASRGGVGAQQVANQLSNVYQTLLNNQYTYGINVAQIGDNIALGAIRTGLQLDQTLNQATTSFYTQLANLIAGGSIGGGGTTIRVGA